MPPTVTDSLYLESVNQGITSQTNLSEHLSNVIETNQSNLTDSGDTISSPIDNNRRPNDNNDNAVNDFIDNSCGNIDYEQPDNHNIGDNNNKVKRRNALLEILQNILNYLSQYRANIGNGGDGKEKANNQNDNVPDNQKNCDKSDICYRDGGQERMMLDDEMVEFSFDDKNDAITCLRHEENVDERTKVMFMTDNKDSMAVTLK